MLNRLAITLITTALLALGASGANLSQAEPTTNQAPVRITLEDGSKVAPGYLPVTAASKPAAYTPLRAAHTQAEINALYAHDE
jgi:hypothetical protein